MDGGIVRYYRLVVSRQRTGKKNHTIRECLAQTTDEFQEKLSVLRRASYAEAPDPTMAIGADETQTNLIPLASPIQTTRPFK